MTLQSTTAVPSSAAHPRSAANRFGVDYRLEAARMGPPIVPIIDAHAHIVGTEAPRVYDDARKAFGVTRTYSMTQLPQCQIVRDMLGDSVRFIAFPTFSQSDRGRAFREDYLTTIESFHRDFNSRMLKLWASPRLRDILPGLKEQPFGATDIAEVDSPWRVRACEVGEKLGMMFMVHIADPDTWFKAKYNVPATYGTKLQQYIGLERMLDRFTAPWIAAHMGGWPEDLNFLDAILTRHPNLHLDTSATKWVLRELSLHPKAEVVAFFEKWGMQGRLLFGSDIVVGDDHLRPQKSANANPMADLASSPEMAFDLYASRYWAMRTMFETSYEGESNIADPDLAMLEPAKYDAMSAPKLQGLKLRPELLKMLYHGAAEKLVEAWWAR